MADTMDVDSPSGSKRKAEHDADGSRPTRRIKVSLFDAVAQSWCLSTASLTELYLAGP
jgi:hypothetical protein